MQSLELILHMGGEASCWQDCMGWTFSTAVCGNMMQHHFSGKCKNMMYTKIRIVK